MGKNNKNKHKNNKQIHDPHVHDKNVDGVAEPVNVTVGTAQVNV